MLRLVPGGRQRSPGPVRGHIIDAGGPGRKVCDLLSVPQHGPTESGFRPAVVYFAATASISTRAPMGRAATSKQMRAGISEVKCSA